MTVSDKPKRCFPSKFHMRERELCELKSERGFCKREGILGITRLQSEKNKAVREKRERERIEAVCAGKVETFFYFFF